MSISLAELLPLVGRLDDAPGFDTPRERLRRFLLEHATHLPTIQTLVEECQRSVGGFGVYERSADDINAHGRWRSAGLLDVVLQIETDHTAATLEPLARAVAACGAAGTGEEPTIGLCVVARQSAARGKLASLVAQGQFPGIHVVSARSLLSLAAHASAGRVRHAEIVELLRRSEQLDFMIDLMTRPGPPRR